MVASSDSDRYSFKVKFDEYVDGQTCYGLDKLVLNNNYSDATMMKEAVVYDMFAFLDVDASLYNYARISVNGNIGAYIWRWKQWRNPLPCAITAPIKGICISPTAWKWAAPAG